MVCSDCEGRPAFIASSWVPGSHGRRSWRWLFEQGEGKARTAACSWHPGDPLGGDGTGRGALHQCGGVHVRAGAGGRWRAAPSSRAGRVRRQLDEDV